MRLAILHTRLSGYLAACLREFKARTAAELLIYCWPNQADAPFNVSMFADLGEIRNRRDHDDAEIEAAVRAFQPDAILTSGWVDKGYVKICKSLRKTGVPVIAGCDTQWKGSVRQHLAAFTAPLHIRKAIDVLWVTGERQAVLARALGYSGERLWDGYYACDWGRFAGVRRDGLGVPTCRQRRETADEEEESISETSPPRWGQVGAARRSDPTFLYVGRYAPEKGLDTLAEAYRIYCGQVERPWRLVCAGAGPLRETLVAAGAEDRGFVQPSDLPALIGEAAAFVLPSRFEPWGVVAHEAAASGLPLILSDACGAGVHLLRDLHNGFLFAAGNAAALARAMVRMHGSTSERRQAFGGASHELSKQYTPQRWAETFIQGLKQLQSG